MNRVSHPIVTTLSKDMTQNTMLGETKEDDHLSVRNSRC
jgi:hypothetical protein